MLFALYASVAIAISSVRGIEWESPIRIESITPSLFINTSDAITLIAIIANVIRTALVISPSIVIKASK